MRILIVSKEGDGVGIAHRLQTEGHTVHLWIKSPHFQHTLRNIVERPTSWRPLLPQVDLVLFDTVGFSHHEALLAKLGKPSLGLNPLADLLELDRGKAMETMKQAGVTVPSYETFPNANAARAILERWEPPGYAIKPFDNEAVGKTYLCDDPQLFDWALSTFDNNTKLLVQSLIPDAIEVSTEGWYNGADWITPFNHTFEEKRMMPGGSGQMTGCMGNVVVRVDEPNSLVQQTLFKLEPFLKRFGYRGPIDINCLVTRQHAYALELTCRFGYDAIEALLEGLKEPAGRFFMDIAQGTKKAMDLTNDYMIAVRVSRDPYPFAYPAEVKEPDKGMPVVGLSDKNMRHVFLTDVYLTADGYKYAAGDGVVYKATARGREVKEARQRVYTTIHNIKGFDLQWRNDIGARVDKDMQTLREWRWL